MKGWQSCGITGDWLKNAAPTPEPCHIGVLSEGEHILVETPEKKARAKCCNPSRTHVPVSPDTFSNFVEKYF